MKALKPQDSFEIIMALLAIFPATASVAYVGMFASLLWRYTGLDKDMRTISQKSEDEWRQAIQEALKTTHNGMTTPQKKAMDAIKIAYAEIAPESLEIDCDKFLEESGAFVQNVKNSLFPEEHIEHCEIVFQHFKRNLWNAFKKRQTVLNEIILKKQENHSQDSEALRSELQSLQLVVNELSKLVCLLQEEQSESFIISREANIRATEYFIGRENVIQKIQEKIKNREKLLLVSGLGGMGKTHLCRYLFQQYHNDYLEGKPVPMSYMAFFTYDPTGLDAMFYKGLGLDAKAMHNTDMSEEYERMWEMLHEYSDSKPGLLIFIDNIPPEINVKKELSKLETLSCAMILTSRRPKITGFESIALDRLSLEECEEIFLKINPTVQNHERDILQKILAFYADRHTLTVERLAYISYTKTWSMSDLIKKLDEVSFRIKYHDDDGEEMNLMEEYAKLYRLENLPLGEQNILLGFSLLADQSIPSATCRQWLLDDATRIDPEHIHEDSIHELYRKGWLEYDDSGRTYHLHTVYSEMLRLTYPQNFASHFQLVKHITDAVYCDDSEIFTRVLPFFPHALSIAQKLKSEEKEMSYLCSRIALLYKEQGWHEQALEWFQKTMAISEKAFGVKHPCTVATNINVAYEHHSLGDYNRALDLYHNCLNALKDLYGEEHSEVANVYNNIASVYKSKGNYPLALEYLKKALTMNDKFLGSDHPGTANIQNSIAGVYRELGWYDKALGLYRQILPVYEKAFGKRHRSTALMYHNIAAVSKDKGDYSQALKYNKLALAIYEDILGEEHLVTATTYNNIGNVYTLRGDANVGLEWLQKALTVREKFLGNKHPVTATTYNNIGEAYRILGDDTKALEWYQKALAIRERVFGENHPVTATTYSNIAVTYQSMKKYTLASVFHQKALKACEKSLGKKHPYTARTYNNFAIMLGEEGNYPEALIWFHKAWIINEKALGKDHPHTTSALSNLLICYEESGNTEPFEEWLHAANGKSMSEHESGSKSDDD